MNLKPGQWIYFWQSSLTKGRKYKGVVRRVYAHGFEVMTRSGVFHVCDQAHFAGEVPADQIPPLTKKVAHGFSWRRG